MEIGARAGGQAMVFVFAIAASFAIADTAAAHGFPDTESPVDKAEHLLERLRAQANAAVDAGGSQALWNGTLSVYDKAKKWDFPNGVARLTACFWNGSTALQDKVIQHDSAWEKLNGQRYVNLEVSYKDASGKTRICQDAKSADLRISLDGKDANLQGDYTTGREAGQYWSDLGKLSKGNKFKVSVNLPSLTTSGNLNTDDIFLVLHELGHARGLTHEHQRAECAGQFDLDQMAKDWSAWSHGELSIEAARKKAERAVATYVAGTPGEDITYVGAYDKASVMQYNVPANWLKKTADGKESPCARGKIKDPSDGDRATLIAVYGPYMPNFKLKPSENSGSARESLKALGASIRAERSSAKRTAKLEKALNELEATRSELERLGFIE
jgi:hypothetical protein